MIIRFVFREPIEFNSVTTHVHMHNTLTDQQPEASNHGYTVLITLCDKLISGLSREPKALAYTLLGKGLFSREKVEEIVQIPATDTQNARKIYDVVLGCVQHFPHRYNDFLAVLEEKALIYGDLLTALKEAYLKLGKNLSKNTQKWNDILTTQFRV